MTSEPYPKSRQLARGERRYRRKVGGGKQWQKIIAEKGIVCRFHERESYLPFFVHGGGYTVEYHHLIARGASGLGDDVADNIIPLCPVCHEQITRRNEKALRLLAESLSDAEYAYVIGKLGEDGPRRLFGV